MANPYEVEHNIAEEAPRPRRRQVDMSTFTALANQLDTDPPASGPAHNNPHATPTPVDSADLFRLLQDQFLQLLRDAPSAENEGLLRALVDALERDVRDPRVRGVGQDFLDALERVSVGRTADEAACPICAERFRDTEWPLLVRLPCHDSHVFDLECVAPWLRAKGTCPMCRTDLARPKEKRVVVQADDEEDEDPDMMYA